MFICAWSPTENLLASSSGDSTARIWKMPAEFEGGSKLKDIETILQHSTDGIDSPALTNTLVESQNRGKDPEIKKDVTTIEWNVRLEEECFDFMLILLGRWNIDCFRFIQWTRSHLE